jgi:hypothetical protein
MALIVAILALGLMLFQVGRAADSRSQAQTAADAAALAGAREISEQLASLYDSAAGIDETAVRSAAADYAQRNGGELIELDVEALDVLVEVRTARRLGRSGEGIGTAGHRGIARARARLEAPVGEGGGIPTGSLSAGVRDAIALGASLGLTVSSALRPGDTDSLHSLGLAVDLTGTPEQMAGFYRAALRRYRYIEELFYDPLGGIDKNIQIGAIGGHTDHVHIALLGDPLGPGETEGEPAADLPHDPHAVAPLASQSPDIHLVPYED